ncbi:hypothetical protein EC973_009244 [Apophysomyces ossiformis]|uniref:RING-type E3 ubiquitin transferase n=1 Tax=Apophysomyces ossiformis TaxID=679940 RepID=A0A8H7BJY8_9FUNG|nr:hypothetical protein EC973_009244 [Apophysomyces ossiformis]
MEAIATSPTPAATPVASLESPTSQNTERRRGRGRGRGRAQGDLPPRQRHRPRPKSDKSKTESKSTNVNKEPKVTKQAATQNNEEEDEDAELCFICTEPIVTYAVSACDHRTCHLCALRLRSLYKTRNCAYCKAEQKTVVFTKDPEKPFEAYTKEDTPFYDRKLGGRFEDQQTYQDTMLLLQYNCPDPNCDVACDGGWSELKRHVRKVHDRFLCDLCISHKKIFAHEHTLYTYSQLQKHNRQGDKAVNKDDDTGFKGHPECQFCRTNFYGDDELFEHCRDKHEQCHLCVRHGIRHEYFENYDSLEAHFKKEHYLCFYRECLDKKFVVFDTDIDLKAHEVEEHGASVSRLQRAKQTEARRVDVNFEYTSQHQSRRERPRPSDRRKKDRQDESESQASDQCATENITLSEQDFPSMAGVANALPAASSSSSTAGTSKKALFKKPAGFGALSSNAEQWPTLGESSTKETASTSAAPAEVISSHAAFLDRIGDMFKNVDKVVRFRHLTTAYRNSNIDGETYVNDVFELCNGNVEHASKIFKGVEELMDHEEKKWEIVRLWRNKKTATEAFPTLESSPAGHGTSPRVLVIKSANTRVGGTRATGRSRAGVWDRVASAAVDASKTASPRSSPHSSRPNTPPLTTTHLPASKTAWAGGSGSGSHLTADTFPALSSSSSNAAQHFPSLPTTSRPSFRGRGRPLTNTQNNPWDRSQGLSGGEPPSPGEETELPTESKKKKGKKNKQVLFRVGL